MKLQPNLIVCQREEDIPLEVEQLRDNIVCYMTVQKVWQLLLILVGCIYNFFYFSPLPFYISTSWPLLGKILEALPLTLMTFIYLPFVIYFVLARFLTPNWIEQYYKASLVLIEIEPSEQTIGKFAQNDICYLLKELSNRMGFLVDPGIFLYDKQKEEANAFYTNLIDHHTKTHKIVLHKNLLFILNESELRAAIAHELGHMRQPWPPIFRSARYSRTCELLADYHALLYAGLLPTVNALIKIYARKNYLSALWERAREILLESGFEVESIGELLEKAKAHINPLVIEEQEGESDAERFVRDITKHFPPSQPTGWQRIKLWMNLREVRKLRKWRKEWKRHLPAQFAQFYKDRHIDQQEFNVLVGRLSQDKESDLFVPSLPQERHDASHPSLRERLLFLSRCSNNSRDLGDTTLNSQNSEFRGHAT